MLRKMLSRRPVKRGWDVVLDREGPKALGIACDGKPDQISMDLSLPEIDRTPCDAVMAPTTDLMHGDRERTLPAGRDEYFTKPVDFSRLLVETERFPSTDAGG